MACQLQLQNWSLRELALTTSYQQAFLKKDIVRESDDLNVNKKKKTFNSIPQSWRAKSRVCDQHLQLNKLCLQCHKHSIQPCNRLRWWKPSLMQEVKDPCKQYLSTGTDCWHSKEVFRVGRTWVQAWGFLSMARSELERNLLYYWSL